MTVSVLLPCYNAAPTLRASIYSVLAQTYSDFELLVLDDGSDERIDPIDDPRVTILRSDKNLGLSRQLNLGLDVARGSYIARLDADDLAMPERFEKQVTLLEAAPEIGICGSQAQLFDAAGNREIWGYPTRPDSVHGTLFLRSSFLHPGVMMRKSVIDEHGLRYDPEIAVAQDYDLWYRMLRVTRGTNLPECLTLYRVSDSQLTRSQSGTKDTETRSLRATILADLGLRDGLDLYEQVLAPHWEESECFYSAAADWLNSIFAANESTRVFPRRALAELLADMFFQRCQCATRRGFNGLEFFQRLVFAKQFHPGAVELLRLRMKSVLKPSLAS